MLNCVVLGTNLLKYLGISKVVIQSYEFRLLEYAFKQH